MSKREKRPNRQKSTLEMLPKPKLIATAKKDIRHLFKASASPGKPKKK